MPTNAIFLYPWTKLIKDLRDALNSVNRQAQVLDGKWEKLLPKVTQVPLFPIVMRPCSLACQGSISERTSTLSTGASELLVPPALHQQSSTDVSSSVTNSAPRPRGLPLGEVEQGSKATSNSAASQARRQRQQADEERGKGTDRARKKPSKLKDKMGTRQQEQFSEKVNFWPSKHKQMLTRNFLHRRLKSLPVYRPKVSKSIAHLSPLRRRVGDMLVTTSP